MIERRRFLKLCAACGLAAPLRAAGGSALQIEYPVEAARLRRALPSGFEALEPARVRLDWSGDAAWLLAAARNENREGWLVLRGWTADERKLRVAREALGLPVFPGEASFDGSAAEIRADGRTLVRAAVSAGEPIAPPTEEKLLALDFRLAPDWTSDAGPEHAESLTLKRSVEGDRRQAAVESFELPEASADHPIIELEPAGEIAGRMGGATDQARVESSREIQAAANVAPLRYGRPRTDERAWTPAGWRSETTAWTLSDAEVARVREREKLRLRPVQMIEVDAMVSQEAHRALLPPPCNPAGRPMVKILGLRSDGADISAAPFTEAWLLAFAIVANRPAWYAVSHIVTAGGDEVVGRETFGYPTKRGEPEVVVTPFDFSLTVQRRGREVVYAAGAVQGFSTGTTLLQNGVVGLRASRAGRAAELVYQHWHYQGLRRRVDPKSLVLDLSSKAAEEGGVATDPWFELGPIRPYAAMVIDGGGMQRAPGETIATVEDFEPYYRERGDGLLPWESGQAAAPKLLIS